ncbi:putative acyl-CoA dehydrogenase fadE35 [Mycobacterium xenopi 4042]|uniref:Putative acyl-CoA dehydrogenase fadE35 n=1 Tax=Mycobacterium xenopi 4042 TaxID=1299334 RepID=X8DY05_MYCXE|nr:putative acyl-CoA dehydrogenase fadE35 [Mycobacterium xenopi 4042]
MLKDDARRAGVNPSLPLFASNYMLNQADIGMGCALGTGPTWSRPSSLRTPRPTCAITCWRSSRRASGKGRPHSC